jgi:hypothetical protein
MVVSHNNTTFLPIGFIKSYYSSPKETKLDELSILVMSMTIVGFFILNLIQHLGLFL